MQLLFLDATVKGLDDLAGKSRRFETRIPNLSFHLYILLPQTRIRGNMTQKYEKSFRTKNLRGCGR